jgi:prepilin-type N-terminal cleavage/methylation domain-containing protein
MSRRVTHPKGFTLLEVSIGLVLMGLALAVTTMSISAVTSAQLKKTTGMIQGLMRDTYTRAALSGNAHRVVFDMEAETYWVEMTEGGVVMPRGKLELTREGLAFLDPVDERLEGIEADTDDEEDRTRIQLFKPKSWTPVPFPGDDRLDEVRPAKLPSDIWFTSIWVDHLAEAAKGGQVAVHFYPGGYTQEAFITIADDEKGEDALTLVTNPLTGEVYVETEIPEIPKEY